MKYLNHLFFILILSIGFSISAQTPAEVNTELKKRNITSQSDVDAELAKRGMTVSEARNMASVYGIDYDDYIAKYILPTTPKAPEVLVQPDLQPAEAPTKIIIAADNFNTGNTQNVVAPKVDASYFGYDIFQNNPFANKDYLVGNIDEGYLLSPGDELRLYIWGSHSYQAEVKIDLNGNIALPNNGVFFAAGYTFKTLKEKLTNYLGKSYGGLISNPSSAFIDISLTQLRPVSVTVIGESNTPGPHLINGFATVLNALYASGGIKTSGSLREIRVYRNNELIKTVDLYDYITKGSLDADVRLMNNDVIFIPNRFSSITISGAVRRGAIFELKPTEALNELIGFSGGLLPTASLKDVAITRVIPFADRKENGVYANTITSVNLSDLYQNNQNFALFDGDKITVKNILEKVLNQVSIRGSVKRPGTYPLSKYTDLRSLITVAADSLQPNTYMNKLDIFSINEDGSRYFKTFNLSEVLNGEVRVSLQNDDDVVVYNMGDLQDAKTVEIAGFVRESKTMIWSADLSLFDVLFSSANLEELQYKSKVLTSRVDVKRFNPQSGKFALQTYDLDEIISAKKSVLLLPKDKVIVYSKDINTVLNEKIVINGFVKNPGEYELFENMTVEDLILQAGGFTQYADKTNVDIARPSFNVNTGQVSETINVVINSDYLIGVASKENTTSFYLENNDIVNVRMIEGFQTQKTIQISGEVRNPGNVTLENKKQSIDQIIKRVGGLTPFASLEASYILRGGQPFIFNLEKDDRSTPFLENGDQIIIQSNYGTVQVLGSVLNEGLFVWQEGKRLKKYIKQTGGRKGKKYKTTIEYPDGTIKLKKWYTNPKVLANSKVLVYEKPIKLKKEGSFMNDFIEVFSIVTGALTTIILARAL